MSKIRTGRLALLAMVLHALPAAHAQIHREFDPVSGILTLSYIPRDPLPAKAEQPAPRKPQAQKPPATACKCPSDPAPAHAAAQPPAVPVSVRSSRDDERLQILLDELKAERRAYQQSMTAGAPAAQLRRYKENIAALEREIAAARR